MSEWMRTHTEDGYFIHSERRLLHHSCLIPCRLEYRPQLVCGTGTSLSTGSGEKHELGLPAGKDVTSSPRMLHGALGGRDSELIVKAGYLTAENAIPTRVVEKQLHLGTGEIDDLRGAWRSRPPRAIPGELVDSPSNSRVESPPHLPCTTLHIIYHHLNPQFVDLQGECNLSWSGGASPTMILGSILVSLTWSPAIGAARRLF